MGNGNYGFERPYQPKSLVMDTALVLVLCSIMAFVVKMRKIWFSVPHALYRIHLWQHKDTNLQKNKKKKKKKTQESGEHQPKALNCARYGSQTPRIGAGEPLPGGSNIPLISLWREAHFCVQAVFSAPVAAFSWSSDFKLQVEAVSCGSSFSQGRGGTPVNLSTNIGSSPG